MKFYAIFDGGKSAGNVQLADDATPPAGAVEVPQSLFGKQLKLDAAGKPVEKPQAEIDAERAALEVPALRQVGYQAVSARCEALLAKLKTGYPESEVLTWAQQSVEAKAFAQNASAPTPLLLALAQARGVPLAVLSARVTTKTEAFSIACGALIGNRQRLEDLLESATTVAQLRAINIDTGWLAL